MKLKDSIRENVLDTALFLFNTNGYYPVSLENIAKQAGIAKGTLYKYFGDKNGLICEVLKKRDLYFKESLNYVTTIFTEPKDKINAIISWHIRWFNSNDYYGCMFVRAQAECSSKNIQSIVQIHKKWIENLILECLGDNKQHQIQIAHIIMLVLEGMISYSMLFNLKEYHFLEEKNYIFQLIDQ